MRLACFVPPVWSCCVPCQDWAWDSSDAICGSAHRRPHSRWCLVATRAGVCVSASLYAGGTLAPGVWTNRGKGTRSDDHEGKIKGKEMNVFVHVKPAICVLYISICITLPLRVWQHTFLLQEWDMKMFNIQLNAKYISSVYTSTVFKRPILAVGWNTSPALWIIVINFHY